MKIVLLGPDGQVGWELRRSLAPLGEVIALPRRLAADPSLCGDLTQAERLVDTLRALRP
ncbi:MAG: dTDP-4-dehydrorhamnose reductase, partial [Betaproteobacteria bacterium]|nr:dTDP-4-dehydrorhamnose reductase [Betaproteobacteria bacterium]